MVVEGEKCKGDGNLVEGDASSQKFSRDGLGYMYCNCWF
jgi:hypothetical protein